MVLFAPHSAALSGRSCSLGNNWRNTRSIVGGHPNNYNPAHPRVLLPSSTQVSKSSRGRQCLYGMYPRTKRAIWSQLSEKWLLLTITSAVIEDVADYFISCGSYYDESPATDLVHSIYLVPKSDTIAAEVADNVSTPLRDRCYDGTTVSDYLSEVFPQENWNFYGHFWSGTPWQLFQRKQKVYIARDGILIFMVW